MALKKNSIRVGVILQTQDTSKLHYLYRIVIITCTSISISITAAMLKLKQLPLMKYYLALLHSVGFKETWIAIANNFFSRDINDSETG